MLENMRLAGNCVLITGGASGIGLALAGHFHRAGSEVILCGRRKEALAHAAHALPGVRVRPCDLTREGERKALATWLEHEAPQLNVLINNAGIQCRVKLAETAHPAAWAALHEEISINLEAPVDLTLRLLPLLRRNARAVIVNVTTGLAFVPLAAAPIYSASKAALHSFTLSLRHQMGAAGVEVVEILPPAVDTDLGGPGLHTFGMKLEEFASEAARRLDAGETEIAVGFAAQAEQATPSERAAMFARLNTAH